MRRILFILGGLIISNSAAFALEYPCFTLPRDVDIGFGILGWRIATTDANCIYNRFAGNICDAFVSAVWNNENNFRASYCTELRYGNLRLGNNEQSNYGCNLSHVGAQPSSANDYTMCARFWTGDLGQPFKITGSGGDPKVWNREWRFIDFGAVDSVRAREVVGFHAIAQRWIDQETKSAQGIADGGNKMLKMAYQLASQGVANATGNCAPTIREQAVARANEGLVALRSCLGLAKSNSEAMTCYFSFKTNYLEQIKTAMCK